MRYALDPAASDLWTEDPTPLTACVCVALSLIRVLAGECVSHVTGTSTALSSTSSDPTHELRHGEIQDPAKRKQRVSVLVLLS